MKKKQKNFHSFGKRISTIVLCCLLVSSCVTQSMAAYASEMPLSPGPEVQKESEDKDSTSSGAEVGSEDAESGETGAHTEGSDPEGESTIDGEEVTDPELTPEEEADKESVGDEVQNPGTSASEDKDKELKAEDLLPNAVLPEVELFDVQPADIVDAEGLKNAIQPSVLLFLSPGSTAVESGKTVGGQLSYTTFIQNDQILEDVVFELSCTYGQISPPQNAGSINNITYGPGGQTMEITVGKISNADAGDVNGIPFSVKFPSYLTPNEQEDIIRVSQIRYTNAEGDEIVVDTTKSGFKSWDYGSSGLDYRADLKAKASLAWKYDLTRSKEIISLEYGYTAENKVAVADANFRISAKNERINQADGTVHTGELVVAVKLTPSANVLLQKEDLTFTALTPKIIEKDGYLVVYWTVSGGTGEMPDFAQNITIDKVGMKSELDGTFKDGTITCETIVWDKDSLTEYGLGLGKAVAKYTADGKDAQTKAIASAPKREIIVKVATAPPTEDNKEYEKTRNTFKKKMNVRDYGNGDTRDFITKDTAYEKDDRDKIWFSFDFENKSGKKLDELVILEAEGTGFNPKYLQIISADPGTTVGGNVPKIEIALSSDPGTFALLPNGDPETVIRNLLSAAGAGTYVSALRFVYTDVEIGDKPSLEPKILFQAAEGIDGSLEGKLTSQITNTGKLLYRLTDNAGEPRKFDIAAEDRVTYVASYAEQIKANKSAKNLTRPDADYNGDRIFNAGDEIEYTIDIAYEDILDTKYGNPAMKKLEITDIMSEFLDGVTDSKVKVIVISKNGNTTMKPSGGSAIIEGNKTTYTGVPVNPTTQTDGKTTFILTLEGDFHRGDKIQIIYQSKVKDPLPDKTTYPLKVINKFEVKVWYGPGSGGGGGGTIPNRGSGSNEFHVYDKNVMVDAYKEIVEADGKTIGKTLTITPGQEVYFALYGFVRQGEAKNAIIADYLPFGFTDFSVQSVKSGQTTYLANGRVNLPASKNSLQPHAGYNPIWPNVAIPGQQQILFVEVAGKNDGNGTVVPFAAGEFIQVIVKAKAPATIDFNGASSKEFINYTFFEPNAAPGSGKEAPGKYFVSNQREGKLYPCPSQTDANSVKYADIIKKFMGDSYAWPTGGTSLLGADVKLTAYKDTAKVSIEKYITNEYGVGKNPSKVTPVPPVYKEGETVYYYSGVSNPSEGLLNNTIYIEKIVDYLPVGQTTDRILFSGKVGVGPTDGNNKIYLHRAAGQPGEAFLVPLGSAVSGAYGYYKVEDDVVTIGSEQRVRVTITFYDQAGQPFSIGIEKGGTLAYRYQGKIDLTDDEIKGITANVKNELAMYVEKVVLSDGTSIGAGQDLHDRLTVSPGRKSIVIGNEKWDVSTDDEGGVVLLAEAEMKYESLRVLPGIVKKHANANDNYVNAASGINVPWKITVSNGTGKLIKTMSDYRVYDPLPQGADMTDAQLAALNQYLQDNNLLQAGAAMPAATVNHNVLVIEGLKELQPGEELSFPIELHLSSGAIGAVFNKAYVVPQEHFTEVPTGKGNRVTAENMPNGLKELDVKTDGVENAASITISNQFGAVSLKEVSDGTSSVPNGANHELEVTRGSEVTYSYHLENTGQYEYGKITIIDILPAANDQYVLNSAGRDSAWSPLMKANPNFTAKISGVSETKFKIYYSSKATIADGDWGSDPGWTTAASWNFTIDGQPKSFKIVFDDEVKLNNGQKLTISWNMEVPGDAPAGQLAWNSAAFGVTADVAGVKRFNAEPVKVGLKVKDEKSEKVEIEKALYLHQSVSKTFVKTFYFKVEGPNGFEKVITLTYDGQHGANNQFTAVHPSGQSGYDQYIAMMPLHELSYGEYTIHEVDANGNSLSDLTETFVIAGQGQKKTVNNGKSVTFSFTNTQRVGHLQINKEVINNISGVTPDTTFKFNIYDEANTLINGNQPYEVVIDPTTGKGQGELLTLPAGKYRVEEINTSLSHVYQVVFDPADGLITVEAGDETTAAVVTATNTLLKEYGIIKISKKVINKTSKTPDKQFTFEIRDAKTNDLVDMVTITVDENLEGSREIALPAGDYVVSEVTSGLLHTYTISISGEGKVSAIWNKEEEKPNTITVLVTNTLSSSGGGGGGEKPKPPGPGPEGPGTPGGPGPEGPGTNPGGPGTNPESPGPNPGGPEEWIDDEDTPLGRWIPDGNGGWTFEEYTPLGNLPQTGTAGIPAAAGVAMILLLGAAGLRFRKREREER